MFRMISRENQATELKRNGADLSRRRGIRINITQRTKSIKRKNDKDEHSRGDDSGGEGIGYSV